MAQQGVGAVLTPDANLDSSSHIGCLIITCGSICRDASALLCLLWVPMLICKYQHTQREGGRERGEEGQRSRVWRRGDKRGEGKKGREGREGPGMAVHACNHSKEVEIGGSLALAN